MAQCVVHALRLQKIYYFLNGSKNLGTQWYLKPTTHPLLLVLVLTAHAVLDVASLHLCVCCQCAVVRRRAIAWPSTTA